MLHIDLKVSLYGCQHHHLGRDYRLVSKRNVWVAMMYHFSEFVIIIIKITTFKLSVDSMHCSITLSNMSMLGFMLELGGLGLIVKSLICLIHGWNLLP